VAQLDIVLEVYCPNCNAVKTYRTKRKGIWERFILYPLGFRAYRCENCDHRFCIRSR
jgi:hypothetical protein